MFTFDDPPVSFETKKDLASLILVVFASTNYAFSFVKKKKLRI
jgi:hypothetical protein